MAKAEWTATDQMSLKEKCEKLLSEWQREIKGFEANYQFGRCGTDDHSFAHGMCEQLEECATYLEVILESDLGEESKNG